jgi:hypothetical protein
MQRRCSMSCVTTISKLRCRDRPTRPHVGKVRIGPHFFRKRDRTRRSATGRLRVSQVTPCGYLLRRIARPPWRGEERSRPNGAARICQRKPCSQAPSVFSARLHVGTLALALDSKTQTMSGRPAGQAAALGTPKAHIDFPLIYMGLRRADRKVSAWCQPIQIIAATNSMTATGFS